MATWMSISSATVRQLSMAAGVVPQSSVQLEADPPASTCSPRVGQAETLPRRET